MVGFGTTSCCGFREFKGLTTRPKEDMTAFCAGWLRHNTHGDAHGAFAFFSDNNVGGNKAVKLAKYIKDNKLGIIHKTNSKLNPSSGNKLVVCMFEPDNKKLKEWDKKHNPSLFNDGDIVKLKDGTPDLNGCSFTGQAIYQGNGVEGYVVLQRLDRTTGSGRNGLWNFRRGELRHLEIVKTTETDVFAQNEIVDW